MGLLYHAPCALKLRGTTSVSIHDDDDDDAPYISIVGEASDMPPLPEGAHIDPEVARGASPWLDTYIEHSERWSPRAYYGFHEATGLWVLSTVAARRIRLDVGGERYTNLDE